MAVEVRAGRVLLRARAVAADADPVQPVEQRDAEAGAPQGRGALDRGLVAPATRIAIGSQTRTMTITPAR
jgi:hypothetical protein